MKDYRLSEIKEICKTNACARCEFSEDGIGCIAIHANALPRSWEIESTTEDEMTVNVRQLWGMLVEFANGMDNLKKYGFEYLEEIVNSMTADEFIKYFTMRNNVKRMTLKEIESELGYSVEIIEE